MKSQGQKKFDRAHEFADHMNSALTEAAARYDRRGGPFEDVAANLRARANAFRDMSLQMDAIDKSVML